MVDFQSGTQSLYQEYYDVLKENESGLSQEERLNRLQDLDIIKEQLQEKVRALERELAATQEHIVDESVPTFLEKKWVRGKSKKNLAEGSDNSDKGKDNEKEKEETSGKRGAYNIANRYTFDKYLESTEILQKHGTLPSSDDWEKRLELLKMFYPHMKIVNILKETINTQQERPRMSLDSDDEEEADTEALLVPVIDILKFDIFFPKFFRFNISLSIETATEQVKELHINIQEGSSIETDQLQDLIAFCESRKDISMFMYAVHSYVSLWKNRLATFSDIYTSFIGFLNINDDKAAPKKSAMPSIQRKLYTFTKFKNEESLVLSKVKKVNVRTRAEDLDAINNDIPLSIVRSEEQLHSLILNWKLFWKLKEGDQTGECFSSIDVSYVKQHPETAKIISIDDLSDTLNGLTINEGVSKAFAQLIDNVLLTDV